MRIITIPQKHVIIIFSEKKLVSIDKEKQQQQILLILQELNNKKQRSLHGKRFILTVILGTYNLFFMSLLTQVIQTKQPKVPLNGVYSAHKLQKPKIKVIISQINLNLVSLRCIIRYKLP